MSESGFCLLCHFLLALSVSPLQPPRPPQREGGKAGGVLPLGCHQMAVEKHCSPGVAEGAFTAVD